MSSKNICFYLLAGIALGTIVYQIEEYRLETRQKALHLKFKYYFPVSEQIIKLKDININPLRTKFQIVFNKY